MVPLDHRLANGDTVEIITASSRPSRDWLVPALGFLASARNRAKVRSFFRKLDEGQNREQGRQMLERELDRLGVRAPPMPRSSPSSGCPASRHSTSASARARSTSRRSRARCTGVCRRRSRRSRARSSDGTSQARAW